MPAGSHPQAATLVQRQDGAYSSQICVCGEPEAPEPPNTPKVIGMDWGRADITHTSEEDNRNGQPLNPVREHLSCLRAVLQRKASQGTGSSRRRCWELLQRLSGRERRLQAGVNTAAPKRLFLGRRPPTVLLPWKTCPRPPLPPVYGGCGGIQKRVDQQRRNQTERRRLNSWAFYPLRQFVQSKAMRVGVKVVVVPPVASLQTCHRCLWLGQREGEGFRGVKPACGWEGGAGFNAANVIALLGRP